MILSYVEFFQELTGYAPYEYQRECFENITVNKSIILQAPTGSGKTLASVLPFVFNWMKWKKGEQTAEKFPRKLIYSLPLRTLANSLHKEVSNLIEKLEFKEKPKITLQTGEYSDDVLFEGDIIFTTIDQTLSNILAIPLSLPSKLSNINAGAVISSYLIFDEFHLLDPENSLSTTLTILNKLKKIVPFCLMTATLTDGFISNISKFLNCEIVKVKETDYKSFSFIKRGQKRTINVVDQEIEIENIIKYHKNKTIIICNTVKSCVEKAKLSADYIDKHSLKTKVICLHSRFFQKDRKKKEKEIRQYFGKNSNRDDIILITTQIIEVGLDISCDTMITEVSPINSFLQRLGRLVRWGGEGNIYVFHPEKENVYNEAITEKTFDVLRLYNKYEIDRDLSQTMITEVLSKAENQIFSKIKNDYQSAWEKIVLSWATGNKGLAQELIRNIYSISIILINEDANLSSFFNFDSISMNPFSLKGELKKILDNYEGEIPNIVFNLQPSKFIFDEEDEELELTPIAIDKIKDESIIALNADYVGYSELTGLDFIDNFGIISERIEDKRSKIAISYQYDTFEEHNNWMIEVFKGMSDYQYSLMKIKERNYKEFNFDDLIKFMIICHDFGKLNNKWQNIVQKYQSLRTGKKITELLAHTDFNKENKKDVELLKPFGKKPAHSGIGAYFIQRAMPYLFKMRPGDKLHQFLVGVFVTSVIRHHSAFADSAPEFEINDKSYDYFLSYLYKTIPTLEEIKYPKEKLISSKIDNKISVINFQQSEIAFLYFILVRILRLCDQKSFTKNPRKESLNE